MEAYVVDAHPLVWYVAEDRRLSGKATRLLDQAQEGTVEVLVPTIVLAEIAHIAERKRVPVDVSELLRRMEQGQGFLVSPFDFAVFRTMLTLPSEWEMHDRIIAATAIYHRARVITKDEMLRDATEVETVW